MRPRSRAFVAAAVAALVAASCAAPQKAGSAAPISPLSTAVPEAAGPPGGREGRADLTRAESELQTALGASVADCAAACRALSSLERSAEHLCALSPDECPDAKLRVESARDRVIKACGACR